MRGAIALILAAALGCAATPPPRRSHSPPVPAAVAPPVAGSKGLDDMVRGDMAADHAFPWSAARPLTWSDFQGLPPKEGLEGAKTWVAQYSVWKCRGQEIEFRVIAGFLPRQSWVKAAVLSDSAQRRTLLGHEQTHFDLAEVHARRMRQVLGEEAGPCRKTEAEFAAESDRLAEDEKAEQRRYDVETNHGLLTDQQAAWSLQTRRRLAASE